MEELSHASVSSDGRKKPKNLVRSISRALDIFELLQESPGGLRLADLKRELAIPVSSLHGILATLVERGYLVKDELSMEYRLGAKIFRFTASYQHDSELILQANDVMERLTHKTSETTSLAVLDGDSVVFIHNRVTDGRLQVVNPIGTRLSAHATGLGKIMLAHLSEEELDLIYPHETLVQLTPATNINKKELLVELRKTRERGYAYDDEESTPGVWAVAGCLCDQNHRPLGAICIVSPRFKIREHQRKEWARLVVEAAVEVSARLDL